MLTINVAQVIVPGLFFVAILYVGYLISRLPENDDPHRKEQYRYGLSVSTLNIDNVGCG